MPLPHIAMKETRGNKEGPGVHCSYFRVGGARINDDRGVSN